MKISHKNILAICYLLLSFAGNNVQAGGSMGGGGPPAREKLLEQLLQAQSSAGGLYSTSDGSVGLGINGDLSPELTVTRTTGSGIAIPDVDFSKLRGIKSNIDVESIPSEISQDPLTGLPSTLRSSYRIEDGNTVDSLQLMDRRFLIRNGVDKAVETATK
jgi:hypothetical protein